jgi:hypothetical protein
MPKIPTLRMFILPVILLNNIHPILNIGVNSVAQIDVNIGNVNSSTVALTVHITKSHKYINVIFVHNTPACTTASQVYAIE